MKPEYLTIEQIFNKEDRYNIPIYQRNYAWEESQISQLIQDIYDVYPDGNNYYLGSLIVYKRDNIYETIDGQQRLTTLNILACILKHEAKGNNYFNDVNVNLQFDSRVKSNRTLSYFNENGYASTTLHLHPQMEQAYEIISKKLEELFGREFSESEKFNAFLEYFLTKVKILRIQVPEKTDLNHYFEVMNNRGEQLEKHEVLKSRFLDVLSTCEESEKYRKTFNLIWEACSYMDRYVQYVFKIHHRKALFGKFWNELDFEDFEDICNKTYQTESTLQVADKKNTFLNIVLGKVDRDKDSESEINEEGLERFTPVTSFPHFLLQVLRITVSSSVQLDDKKLISQFEEYIFKKDSVIELSKVFAKNLLELKFLFDNFIVKRDYNNDSESWAILEMKKQQGSDIGYYINTWGDIKEQKKLVLLQSMFHVSFPQTNYKHWLSACLKFLFIHKDEIDIDEFINYLESLSDAFYFNRLNGTLDYHEIIFNDDNTDTEIEPLEKQLKIHLNIGTSVNNFVFNRLDYLLLNDIENQKKMIPLENRDDDYTVFNPNDFEYSFRSSVEHYSPQQPKNNDYPIANIDNFGNLCLISASRNSELSNYSPMAKKEHYKRSKGIESLKQRLMMCYKVWDENSVNEHQANMVALLNTKTTTI